MSDCSGVAENSVHVSCVGNFRKGFRCYAGDNVPIVGKILSGRDATADCEQKE